MLGLSLMTGGILGAAFFLLARLGVDLAFAFALDLGFALAAALVGDFFSFFFLDRPTPCAIGPKFHSLKPSESFVASYSLLCAKFDKVLYAKSTR